MGLAELIFYCVFWGGALALLLALVTGRELHL